MDQLYNMTLSADKADLQVLYISYSNLLLSFYVAYALFSQNRISIFQVAIHAIGDRANDLILDMYASVASDNQMKDRRFRVNPTAKNFTVNSNFLCCSTLYLPCLLRNSII